MATRQTHSFNSSKLEPWLRPRDARTMACAMLGVVATYLRGDRLAQITTPGATLGKWTKADTTKITAPIAAPTLAAAGADGTLPAGIYGLCYTYKNANGETTISPVGAVTVAATNHITVDAIALPAGVSSVNLYSTDAGGNDLHLIANYNGAARIILAPVSSAAAPPTSNTAFLKSDGTQKPTRLAVRDFVTDINGMVYEGTEPYTTGPYASPNDTAMGYDRGYYLLADLTTPMTDDEIAAMGAEKIGVGEKTHIKLA